MNDLPSAKTQNFGDLSASLNLEIPLSDAEKSSLKAESIETQRLRLCVTDQDHYWSDKSGLRNPILCALQRCTNTLWRIYDDGFALEAMPPYRACQLPPESLKEWRRWLVTGQMEAPEWEIELVSTQAKDGYALIQQRQTNLRESCGCSPHNDIHIKPLD